MTTLHKKTILIKALTVMLILCIAFIFLGCFNHTSSSSDNPVSDILRLHIRANSNSRADQEVKLVVRDHVLQFLKVELEDTVGVEAAMQTMRRLLPQIRQISTDTLLRQGFHFAATAHVDTIFFPTVRYQYYTLRRGYYRALIIELGAGTGSNWWCVIYPPLCYVSIHDGGSGGVRYRSFIWDRIRRSS